MNAFRYDNNVEEPKSLKTPIIAIVALSGEGPAEGPKSRIVQLANVLETHNMSFDDFNKIKR